MKTFVIGDIHGAYKALLQCFERSGFDYKKDRLIVLGDVCDGYAQVCECIDELLKIKHLEYILGNHDAWALQWALEGWEESIWLNQGGYNTIASYKNGKMPQKHIALLENAQYWIEDKNRLFVHAGIEPDKPMSQQNGQLLLWDRELLYSARKKHLTDPEYRFGKYDEIFIGHTTTEVFGSLKPLQLCNVWALDTGAGWSGRLTIMDLGTKEYWQSDLTTQLYSRKNTA